jgi:protein-S-isoprenylcysteine O-methyltransferase Ste14
MFGITPDLTQDYRKVQKRLDWGAGNAKITRNPSRPLSTPAGRTVRFFLAFKVVLFTVLVPGTATLYIPHWLLSGGGAQAPDWVLGVPAAACTLVGVAVYLRCAWDFAVQGLGTPAPLDPPKRLVVAGLYRRTRNPMYQGVLLILLAECLLFPDVGLAVYAASFALLFHCFVVYYEEPGLNARFGASYADYCDKVPRWGFASRAFEADAV